MKRNPMIRRGLLLLGMITGMGCLNLSYAQNIQFRYDASGNRVERFVASSRIENESGQLVEETPEEIVEEDKVYPNPTSGRLRFELIREEPAISQVSVLDLNGRLLYRKTFSEQRFEVDITSRPEGIYLLRWTFANQSRSLKIIKQ